MTSLYLPFHYLKINFRQPRNNTYVSELKVQCVLRFVKPRFVNETRFVNTFSGKEKLTNLRMYCIFIKKEF